jgi:hypothetical protein
MGAGALGPAAFAVANRLCEATGRGFWIYAALMRATRQIYLRNAASVLHSIG